MASRKERKLCIWYKIKKKLRKGKMDHLLGLKHFLEASDLGHFYQHFSDMGMELKYLLLANDSDLKEIVSNCIVDKIKLRNAIEIYRKSKTQSNSPTSNVQLQHSRVTDSKEPLLLDQIFSQLETDGTHPLSAAGIASEPSENSPHKSEVTLHPSDVPEGGSSNQLDCSESSISTLMVADADKQNSLAEWIEEWQLVKEVGPLEDKKSLKALLECTTFGKTLLEKQGLPLTPRDRKALVQLIVEHQLRILPSIKDTIRQEVWTNWAKEICSLFKGEVADIYYVPYRVTDRQALPASGLLHNRLITHRRFLNLGSLNKKNNGCSSSSEKTLDDYKSKRLRPLPSALYITEDKENSDSSESCIKWIEVSSSPFDVLIRKWKISFKARHEILKQKSMEEYFKQFPGLCLSRGYQLLVSDFEVAYPLSSTAFDDNFPIIKKRLLELLVEKGSHLRAEAAVSDLLNLATFGEEQGSVAALRCIPYLLKQVAPIPSKIKGKKWKPARSEVSQAFINFVASPADIVRCIDDRLALTQQKGISFGPFIIAVGPSWSNIKQYEVVVLKGVRYQFSDIKTALTTAFKIYFALDVEYMPDAAPCWMFVQRAIFKIITKYDTLYDKSVTLRELIKDCEK